MNNNKELAKQEFMNARKILEHSYNDLNESWQKIEPNYKNISTEKLIEFAKIAQTSCDFYESLQLSVKLGANGIYGALGSEFWRYADSEVAADITAEGRGATHLLDDETLSFFKTTWFDNEEKYFKMIREKFPKLTFHNNKFGTIDTSNHIAVYGDTDSLFIEFAKLFESIGLDKQTPVKECCDVIEFIAMEILTPFFNEKLETFAKDRNLENFQEFELEVIIRKIILVAKKKYAGTLIWKDGWYCADKKWLKLGGLELVQTGTSAFVKEAIEKFLYFLVAAQEFDSDMYFKIAVAIKNKVKKLSIGEYASSKGISDFLTKRVIIDKETGHQRHVKKSAVVDGIIRYNNLIMENDLLEYYNKYTSGKVRWYYDENGDTFAWPIDEEFPSEIAPKPDVNVMCEKLIFAPVKRLLGNVITQDLKKLGQTSFTKGFGLRKVE